MGRRKDRKKGETHGDAPEREAEREHSGPEAEASPAEGRYAEMRSRGKTARQIRAVANARNDADLAELCDRIIDGTRGEPDPATEDGGEREDAPGVETESGDHEEAPVIEESDAPEEDGMTEDVNAPGDNGEEAERGNADGGESAGEPDKDGEDKPEAEYDTRPVVSLEELRKIDESLGELIENIREASKELHRVRDGLGELRRARRAMGPVARNFHAPGRGHAPRKPSLMSAAADLLAETGQAMNCNQIVQILDERGIWSSPNGKTPGATLYAGLNREIAEKGERSRFARMGKGQYAASESWREQCRAARGDAEPAEAAAGAEVAPEPESD